MDVIQYVVDADARLRHIAALNDLRIGDVAETVKCRPLVNAAESLVGHLRAFVASLSEDLLDNRRDLLERLDTALDSLHQHS